MKITIAQLTGINEFPIDILDREGRLIFTEKENGDYDRYYYDEGANGAYTMVLTVSNGWDYHLFVYDDEGKELFYKSREYSSGDYSYGAAANLFINKIIQS